MSVEIKKGTRWRNRRTKRIAVVTYSYPITAFRYVRSEHSDGSDDAYADLAAETRLADSRVQYRYIRKRGRFVQTVWVRRASFLKTFERAK